MVAYGIDRTKDMLLAAGATKITSATPLREGAAYHLMGTARMGDNPEQSVVDKWGRAHEVKNLFIIDGSIMVTSGSVVVTNTIQALALRTADYVTKNVRDLVTT
jgi:choline dehydrogenase-like flavoprotein